MRNFRVEAIVLKRKNIGEADRILTVFTREFGKLQLKAKGVRKLTSKRSSHIEPLNTTVLSYYKGQGMPVLLEAVSLQNFNGIKSDLTKVGFAYHICELIDGLCPENQESEEIFSLIQKVLEEIEKKEVVLASLIHTFEVELLTLLGYYSTGTYDLSGAKASYFIESILERKLKTRQILPLLFENRVI
ncbi:MAG TPA: DNA repair protein RecO [Patescibacteria group bacterium]|nr:DNA repair protein RecO [Patescibacteria group bacterium]